ncbi:cyclic-phosphate processing receiver domain-containing protein [Paludisphaera borealis]|uniref:cyclic-phosphate processing receiver domain-containing protein n=1 Tax=Paludisphaera borealis TaxID=1387353 RepID=UPI0028528C7A|nr:cyclic-phosphate processing receiver domain-containing protein [Paludisphaera borealis]
MFVTETPPRTEVADSASATPVDVAAQTAPNGLEASRVEPVPAASTKPASPHRRVLFMDDDARRVEVFLQRCPEAVWVKSADTCIGRLSECWDEVHLDHDLGGEQFVDTSRDDCGMAVVRWLCAKPRSHHISTRFFIHSYNLAAASLMVECLLRNGYTAEFRPFGFDLVDLLSFEDISPALALRAARARRLRSWRVRLRVFTHRLKRYFHLIPGDRL